eukprot:scaffold3929_cov136-Isochrysis_galbana.AAC.3
MVLQRVERLVQHLISDLVHLADQWGHHIDGPSASRLQGEWVALARVYKHVRIRRPRRHVHQGGRRAEPVVIVQATKQ